MNTAIIMLFLPESSKVPVPGSQAGYLIGGVIALFILGYLIYTLLRPEEF